jgi:phosphatidylglycerophosphate synthase
MNLIRTVRSSLEAQLQPIADHAAARGLTGDALQSATLAAAAAVGALLWLLPKVLPGLHLLALLLPAALLLRALAIMLATLLERQQPALPTPQPALREVTDAATDLLLYLPLATYPGVAAGPVVALVALGLLAEIAGLAAVARGDVRRRDGPMGLSDRMLVFALAGLILAVDPRAAPWLPWLLLPAAALAAATVIQRLRPAAAGD